MGHPLSRGTRKSLGEVSGVPAELLSDRNLLWLAAGRHRITAPHASADCGEGRRSGLSHR